MLKMYKDLAISYILSVITGIIVIDLIFGSLELDFTGVSLIFIWIFFCAKIYNKIAIRRFGEMTDVANQTCRVEEGLNLLLGVYKGKLNHKIDLIVAIHISNYMLHFGKPDIALTYLLPYNPEALFRFKKEVIHKFSYYITLSSCYFQLGRTEEGRAAFDKSKKALNSPYFNKKLKTECENTIKIKYWLNIDEGNQEEILELLEKELKKSQVLLSEISCRFAVVQVLKSCGRLEEAREHITFIRDNGGDTIYAKRVKVTASGLDITEELNVEPWQPNPIQKRHRKALAISIVLAILTLVSLGVVGCLTRKTIYENHYNGSGKQSTFVFDRNGDILLWEQVVHGYYSSQEELDRQFYSYTKYLVLNEYKGCEATLSEKKGVIDFRAVINFKKSRGELDSIFDISTESDYLEQITYNDDNMIIRYRKFLGMKIFAGWINK